MNFKYIFTAILVIAIIFLFYFFGSTIIEKFIPGKVRIEWRDSIVPGKNITIRDTVPIPIYVPKTKLKHDTLAVIDSSVLAELDKYRREYLRMLDSFNLRQISKYDTVYSEPVCLKEQHIEYDFTGIWKIDQVTAAEKIKIKEIYIEVPADLKWYQNPYANLVTGAIVGVAVGVWVAK